MEQTSSTTYTPARKASYERNKEKIAEKEKVKKRWLKYYADNKDAIAERRKARRAQQAKRPIDEAKIERYDALQAELKELKKEVALKKLRATLEAKRQPPTSPVSPLPAPPAPSPAPPA
jgi:hypothetical protein